MAEYLVRLYYSIAEMVTLLVTGRPESGSGRIEIINFIPDRKGINHDRLP